MKKKFTNMENKIIDKSSYDYDIHRRAWNRAIDVKPNTIIYCENTKDISAVLRVVKKEQFPLRIRSGRHHYEGFSTGDNVTILDVSKMNDIKIDETKDTVTIGAGVTNKELYDAVNSKGYAISGGGCPTVGVTGYVLGGGWGYSARYLGLGCDNLIECEIIDNSGNLITANEKGHRDLFWALRGAGAGNFGVVTSMTFKLEKKVKNVTLVLFKYKEISIDEKVNVIKTVQEEFKGIDKRFNVKIAIYNSVENGKGIYMTGLFYGTKEEAKNVLNPFIGITDNEDLKLEEMSILDANNYIQDSHPDFEHYKSGGRFVYEDLKDDEIRNLVEFTETRPYGSIYVAVSLYGLGGEIDKYSNDDMAYAHRGASFILGMQSVFEDNKDKEINNDFVLKMYEYSKNITKGSYVAFPIKELENYEKEYFMDNVEKLKVVKTEYDKREIFEYPQGIIPNKF
ncbi:MAG: FAD-binding protein [Sarcina sp.]